MQDTLIPGLGSSPGEGIGYLLQYSGASLVAQMRKNLPAMRETRFNPWIEKIPWKRAWQPTPVFLPGESQWTEEPGELQSVRSQRVRHDWTTKYSILRLPRWCWWQRTHLPTQGDIGDERSIPGLGRFSGGRNGNPL